MQLVSRQAGAHIFFFALTSSERALQAAGIRSRSALTRKAPAREPFNRTFGGGVIQLHRCETGTRTQRRNGRLRTPFLAEGWVPVKAVLRLSDRYGPERFRRFAGKTESG